MSTEPETGKTAYQIPSTDPAMEVVDVSAAMLDSDRRVYSKMGKKAKLDSLLEWRIKLKVAEEKNLLKLVVTPPPPPVAVKAEAEESLDVDVEGDGEVQPKLTTQAAEALLEKLRSERKMYPCYTVKCNNTSCYSPSCRAVGLLETKIRIDKEEEEKRKVATEKKRMYSNACTTGPVVLRRLLLDDDQPGSMKSAKKRKAPVKYPMMSNYTTKSKKRTIFVLPDHELRHLARRHGQGYVQGFHHGSKNNSTAWLYPSSRPLFKSCWFYRTNGLQSLSAAALQLRILWACLRWEDLAIRSGALGLSADGKSQLTTETEIVTTDILKHRHVGRFLEKTQYYQRRVVIPLDVPKTVREVTPSRSGLRKRKMVEAPRLSQPIVTEEWVDEDRLELWVIKHYHERMERAAAAAAASANTPTSSVTKLKGTPQTAGSARLSVEELREKAEQQLRAQRAAHQLKSATATTPGTPGVIRLPITPGAKVLPGTRTLLTTPKSASTGTPNLTRRIIITPDGKKTIVQQVVKSTTAAAGGTLQLIAPSPTGSTTAAPAGKVLMGNLSQMASQLQFIKGPDGKVQVRGLQPGQQLLRGSDGRLTIVNTSSPGVTLAPGATIVSSAAGGTASTAAAPTALGKTIILKTMATPTAGQKIAGQQILLSGNSASLAQQLSSGTLKMGMLNGQQVIFTTKPGNVVNAQPVAAAAASSSTTSAAVATTVVTPVKPGEPSPAVVPTAVTGQTAPAATAAKQTGTVLLTTSTGQRIMVQNSGGTLTPQQIALIQEQLKTQLQAGAGKAGTPPVIVSFARATTAPLTPTATAVAVKPAATAGTSGATSTATASTAAVTPAAKTNAVPPAIAPAQKPPSPEKKFEVTPDYIQQCIRHSLKSGVGPEVEQKLIMMHRLQVEFNSQYPFQMH